MFKSLQGTYVLTISPSLQIRADVRDSLREIGIASYSVVDFRQAREAMRARMPNLIVVDSELKGDDFEAFRRELLDEVFEMPFVEISPDDSSFDMSGFGEFSDVMSPDGRRDTRYVNHSFNKRSLQKFCSFQRRAGGKRGGRKETKTSACFRPPQVARSLSKHSFDFDARSLTSSQTTRCLSLAHTTSWQYSYWRTLPGSPVTFPSKNSTFSAGYHKRTE